MNLCPWQYDVNNARCDSFYHDVYMAGMVLASLSTLHALVQIFYARIKFKKTFLISKKSNLGFKLFRAKVNPIMFQLLFNLGFSVTKLLNYSLNISGLLVNQPYADNGKELIVSFLLFMRLFI